MIDSSWVVMSCLRSCLSFSIEGMMEEFMFLLMVAILALMCLTSCWVFVKLECKVLKRASKSWLRVWAMMTREPKRGGWGQQKFMKNDRYECDTGEEINPME